MSRVSDLAVSLHRKKKSTLDLTTLLYMKEKNEHVDVKKSRTTAFRELLLSCQIWIVFRVE
jgi:hypothetical protein